MKKPLVSIILLVFCFSLLFSVTANADADFNWDEYSLEELLEIQEGLNEKVAEMQWQYAIEHGDRAITLTVEKDSVYIGKTLQITASVEKTLDSAPDATKLVWTSSDDTVATVNGTGTVTGVSKGSVTITCCAEDNNAVFAEQEIDVIVPVSAVEMPETKADVLIKESNEKNGIQLSASIAPEDAFCQELVWTSSNEELATVDQTGYVTALKPGNVTITATSPDEFSNGTKKAACNITITQAVSSLKLDKETLVMNVGSTGALTVSILPDTATNKAVTWESSDPEVVTVNNGQIRAVAGGDATISVKAVDGSEASAACEVSVIQMVSSIKIEETASPIVLPLDEKMTLTPVVEPETATNRDVAWSSSDEKVVSVSEDGVIHAAAEGTAVITCSAVDGSEKSTSVDILVPTAVKSIQLDQEKADIYLGERVTLSAAISPEDATIQTVAWSSSDEAVATVDQKGVVTAVGQGEAVITCEAQDGSGVSATSNVKVFVAAKKITLANTSLNLLLGTDEEKASQQIVFTVEPEDADYQNAVWTSSDETVAKVDENGVVVGLQPGKATITANSADRKVTDTVKASITVLVGNAVKEISLSGIDDMLPKGTTKKLTVTFTPEEVLDSKVSWNSSNEEVLSVDASGNVRGVGVGTATITCNAEDGSGVTASKEITVVQGVTALKASQGSVTLFEGQSITVSAIASPEDATNKKVSWTSKDSSIAKVDESGVITAVSKGKTTVIATAQDGSDKTCSVAVVVEPAVPLTLESLGTGIYQADLLAIEVKNVCQTVGIKNFSFDIDLYDYNNNKLVTSGSYSIGDDVYIYAGQVKTIKRTHPGVGQSYKKVITITGVELVDGTFYSIPISKQETWSFTR